MPDAESPASAPQLAAGDLTDLGQLTLSRFQERFGKEAGPKKFAQAMDDGHISRAKMYRQHQGKFRQQQRG